MSDEYDLPEQVPCPFCDGSETELHSPFGTALSVATYWCRQCRTAFEWVKWNDAGAGEREPTAEGSRVAPDEAVPRGPE